MGRGGHAEEDFVRPEVDKLSYQYVKLGNGLQAVLVHDAEADKASAALDVGLLASKPRLRLEGY